MHFLCKCTAELLRNEITVLKCVACFGVVDDDGDDGDESEWLVATGGKRVGGGVLWH